MHRRTGGDNYAGLEWTPSSYGVFLQAMQAPDFGPILGTSRQIRSDEWSVNTPLVQAAVRNKFQRINETSFYREDLRNFVPLPLKDWSLIFKPQLWAFFLLPPATAFSIYWALFMSAFLAGYYLLFRRLGMPGLLAIAACVTVFFHRFHAVLVDYVRAFARGAALDSGAHPVANRVGQRYYMRVGLSGNGVRVCLPSAADYHGMGRTGHHPGVSARFAEIARNYSRCCGWGNRRSRIFPPVLRRNNHRNQKYGIMRDEVFHPPEIPQYSRFCPNFSLLCLSVWGTTCISTGRISAK